MARTNKYTSINFNHVLEKTHHSNSNSNPINGSKTKPATNNNPNNNVFSARTEGRMLVLTRPTPKPVPQPQDRHQHRKKPERPRSEPAPAVSDSISLRPQGQTGAGTGSVGFQPVLGLEKEGTDVIGSPKPNRFVPPHLRPGFVGREERPGLEVIKGLRPVRLVREEERPKSGVGYDRRMRVVGDGSGGGESDLGLLGRPRYGGNRPSSSGCYSGD